MLRRLFLPSLLFLLSFGFYIHNLSFSVYGGDVGDVVSAAFVGGVAHAPGYPLFTQLGFLLTRLPFATPAFLVGLISAFSGAGAVVLYFLTIKRLTGKVFVSVISSVILAFSYLFWFYNEIGEVFALNSLFITLLFFLAILYAQTKKATVFFFFCLTLGLSLTNHQTIVLFMPSFLLLLVPAFWRSTERIKTATAGILGTIAIFGIIYMYIPIAASHNPVINWDNVHDISSFLHLLLRKDYGTFTAGQFQPLTWYQRVLTVKSYLFILLTQLTIPVTLVSIVGLLVLLKKHVRIGLAFLAGYILSGPLFVLYAGFPLSQPFFFGVYERFFTMSSIMVLYFFPFGLQALSEWFGLVMKRKVYVLFFQGIFLLVPLLLIIYNFPKTNLSHVWIGDNLGLDILAPLPKHAVLLLSGDTPLFNTEYMHYARGIRPDVRVINNTALQTDAFFNTYLVQVKKENPQEKNPSNLAIKAMQRVEQHYPLFSSTEFQPASGTHLLWEPYGLIYQLSPSRVTKEEYQTTANTIWNTLHIPQSAGVSTGSLTIAEIPTIYSNALLATGAYFQTQYADSMDTKLFYDKALIADSGNPKAYELLGLYEMNAKNCAAARDNFTQAIQQKPSEEIAYFLRYSVDTICTKDPADKAVVAKQFYQAFGEPITTALKHTLKEKNTTF